MKLKGAVGGGSWRERHAEGEREEEKNRPWDERVHVSL